MIKDEIRDIINEHKGNTEEIVEFIEEEFLQRDCDFGIKTASLIKMILPENIYWDEFSESLDRLVSEKEIEFETFCKIHSAVNIFVLKVLIEMKIKSGKEIDCAV